MSASTLLVLTGPPGAGKSTVAELVVDRLDRSVLVAGDAFHRFLRRDRIDPWLPESNEQNATVVTAQAATTRAFVDGGFNVVFDGVVGPWFLPTFLSACGLEQVDYGVLLPPVEVCLRRIDTRVGHEFADERAARKMHDEFASSLAGYERHVVSADGEDAAATAEAVLDAAAARRLRVRSVPDEKRTPGIFGSRRRA